MSGISHERLQNNLPLPELNLTAADFVDSWNNLKSCREVAEAKTESSTQSDFALGEMAIMIASLGFVAAIAKAL